MQVYRHTLQSLSHEINDSFSKFIRGGRCELENMIGSETIPYFLTLWEKKDFSNKSFKFPLAFLV